MFLLVVALLITAIVYLLLYQFKFIKPGAGKPHLPEHILKDSSGTDSILQRDEVSRAFEKAWLPLTKRFKAYEQKIPASASQLRRKRLINAGSPMGLLEFFAFRVLAVIFVPLIAFIFLSRVLPRKDMLLVVSLLIGYFLPDIWLNSQIKKRQRGILKELPNIIDLLNLCVSGGLDFMLAVNRVVKDLKPSELTRELGEVYRQTQMGKTRREALRNFAWRVDLPEVHSFVRTLVQADRMGTPMSEALKMQAEELRVRRFQRGEAMALKSPIKLLFPLFVFILPVVLILVAGPIILQFSKSNIAF